MKSLLIHNSKIPESAVALFSVNTILVPSTSQLNEDDFDFDTFYDTRLSEILIGKYDIIYISLSLSDFDYLEMNGLRVAHHIRLTERWKHRITPIYFLCQETPLEILRLNPLGNILLTNGIYITNDLTIKEIKSKPELNKSDYEDFLGKIKIDPPSNYQSHHAIANEWALTRSFSMFEKDETNELYIKLKKKILDLAYLKTLHFKYIEARASRQRFNPKKHAHTPIIGGIENMKLGIIDDEINKGWLEFYNYVLNKSLAQSIPFTDFRKDEKREELMARIQNWLLESFKSSEPIDLFIIDLRLHDDDFSEEDFENLSGIQIIKFIKSKNPGVQIVVSTASNKVWNFQKCLDFSVKHFSIKESPETYSSRHDTRASLIHFSKQITSASSQSFLADLFRDIENLKNENIFTKSTGEKEKGFENLIFGKNGLLDQIFNLLVLDTTSETIINQCLLLAFQVLENYCDLASVGSFGSESLSGSRLSSGSIWLKDGTGPKHIFINQPNQKISSWFELFNSRFNFQIEESNETPVSFKVFEKMEIISSYKSGLDVSYLVRMICVLHFRDNIAKEKVDKIISLRYYRSNVAAHLTGKVKQDIKYKISAKDIEFFIQIFKKVFI